MSGLKRVFITVFLILAAGRPPAATVQDRVLIGAYDPAHINGLVFIANDQNFFAFRFLVYRQGTAVEESPRLIEFGPHASDGSYAKVSWRPQLPRYDANNPVVLRWSRVEKNGLIGSLSAPSNVRVAIEVYSPWRQTNKDDGWATFGAHPDHRTILGEQVQNQKSAVPMRRFLLQTDFTADGAASYDDAPEMRKILLEEGQATQRSRPQKTGLYHHAMLSFELGQNKPIGFAALVGDSFDEMERDAGRLLQKPIADRLGEAEKNYDSARTRSDGALGDSFEAINRLVNWNRFYHPEKQLEYMTIHRLPERQLISGATGPMRGTVLSWDTFILATLSSVVDPGSSSGTIRALLEGQLTDGRLPLRRHLQNQPRHEPATLTGRSMPPLGALSVWKVYLVTYDLGLLAWAYPRLLQWNEWWVSERSDSQAWRDGNGDGLLEWGFDAEIELGALGARMTRNPAKLKLAFSESGLEHWMRDEEVAGNPDSTSKPQNDGPRYNDKTHTLEFSPVALNALYALDTEILAMMARELGRAAEAEKLKTRHERIRNLINNKLWSDEDGMYLNRHWDGRFSRRISLENFYPLAAGLADEERAKRILKTLTDKKKFWGEQLLAFIARDDPAFTPQVAERGAIWSASNYLLYLGLRRYGFHNEAAELARQSTRLALSSREKRGEFHDYYSSQDGAAIDPGDDSHGASFAGLMFWPGIEELISADPWAGISIGSLSFKEEARIEQMKYSGAIFDVVSGPKRTVVKRDGKVELECDGPARIRSFRSTERAVSFAIEIKERIRVRVPAVEGRKITVSVDDKVLGSTSPGAEASFKVPEGTHKVFIVK